MTTRKALTVLGFLLSIIMISLVVPAKWVGIEPTQKKQDKIEITSASFLKGSISDTNKDNTISWKELMIGSLDSTEIKNVENKTPDMKVIAQLNDPSNLTASFSKNLYITSTALANKQTGDAKGEQQILNQLVSQEAAKVTRTTYTFKDLNISKTENTATIKQYGNNVATILKDMITKRKIIDDFESLQNFINTKDASSLTPLVDDHQKVEATLKKLIALPVPLSASPYHMLTINRVATYKDTLYNLSMAASDPIRATLFIDSYPDTIVATLRVYNELSTYFDLQNIVFSSKDPGYVFTIGNTIK